MDHLINDYSGWLIPALAVIVLLVVAIKVVNAIVRILSLVLVAAILFGGYTAYGRLTAIQNSVNAVATQHKGQPLSHNAIQNAVFDSLSSHLSSVGLNPSLFQIDVQCAGVQTQIHVRYTDPNYMFGWLSNQSFQLPHSPQVRCNSAPAPKKPKK
jgi:hypothetical protein